MREHPLRGLLRGFVASARCYLIVQAVLLFRDFDWHNWNYQRLAWVAIAPLFFMPRRRADNGRRGHP